MAKTYFIDTKIKEKIQEDFNKKPMPGLSADEYEAYTYSII